MLVFPADGNVPLKINISVIFKLDQYGYGYPDGFANLAIDNEVGILRPRSTGLYAYPLGSE